MANKILTPEARLSFPVLFTPRAPEPGAEPKYSCTLLFPLDANLSALQKAMRDCAMEKWGPAAKEMVAKHQLKWPIKNQEAKSHLAGYREGHYLACSSKTAPGVVNAQLQRIIDPAEVWAGQIVIASVKPYAWAHPTGGKGVSFGLLNLMIVRDDGVRLDGRSAPEEDFAGLAQAEPPESAPQAEEKSDLWD